MSLKGQELHPLERRSAFAVSLVLSFVIILGVACVVAYQDYMKAINATIHSNETRATLLAKLIMEHQRAAIGVLESYADRPELVHAVKNKDFEGTLKHIIEMVKRNPEMDWPFLSNPDSTIWVNYPVDRQVMNKDLSYRDWYRGVSKEWKPYISSVYKLIVGEKDLAVAISVPIFDEKRKVIGILATAQSTAFFQKVLNEVGLNDNAKVTLIDQEGHIVFSNGFPYRKEIISYPALEFIRKALTGEKGNTKVRYFSDGARISYVSFVPLDEIGWSVIVEKTRGEVLRSETPQFALIGVISLLFYGVVALTLVHLRERHRQIKELRKLNEELDGRVRERTAELETRNKALRESEERFRTLAGATFEGVAITEHGRFIDANEQFLHIVGTTRSELIGQEVAPLIAPEDRDRVMANILQGVESHTEHQMYRRDGTQITVEIHGRTISYQDQQVRITAVRDITHRKQTEDALRQSEERLRRMIQTSPVAIGFGDSTGKIFEANESFYRLTGYSRREIQAKQLGWDRLTAPEYAELDRQIMAMLAATGSAGPYEKKYIRKDGSRVPLLLSVSKFPGRDEHIAFIVEITERKRMEEELRRSRDELEVRVQERTAELAQANKELREEIKRREKAEEQLLQTQKPESMGTLTGGIAHDFNNMLGAIVINSEMALLDLPGGSDIRNNLELILKSAIRGRDLVKQMLLFSRKSQKKQETLPLTPIIKETFRLLRSSVPTTIQMELDLKTEEDTVYADPSQIQQVVMNLCTNAAYAMRGTTGVIDLSLETVTFGATDLPEPDMQPGEYVVFSVKDTGTGMDEEVKKRIFEPFFTTKPVGEGTGLGLSVVYGIVKSHKGNITVYSEPGRGSIFRVYLPKADTGVVVKTEVPKPLPGGKERVLFVDDEEIIINSVRNMLEHLGYRVTALTDSREALQLFSEDPSRFDLVLTDQTMPFMTGEDLGKEMMRLRPDIPIILSTGYSDLISAEAAMAMGFRGYIMKPFTLRESAELLRRILDQKGPGEKQKS